MPGRVGFEYVVVRIVPRIERGECLNAGVILICRPKRFLSALVALDRARLLAVEPSLPPETLAELERQLMLIPRIAAGDRAAGPIASLDMSERWHWLSAPSSTMIQPSTIHTGLCIDPDIELKKLYAEMVETTPVTAAERSSLC